MIISPYRHQYASNRFECNNLIKTKALIPLKGILRGVFQNFNPLCGRNPIETDLD